MSELNDGWSPAFNIHKICEGIWSSLQLKGCRTFDALKYPVDDFIGGGIVDPDIHPGYLSESKIQCIIHYWQRNGGSESKGLVIPGALIKVICDHDCYQCPRMTRCFENSQEDRNAYAEIAR